MEQKERPVRDQHSHKDLKCSPQVTLTHGHQECQPGRPLPAAFPLTEAPSGHLTCAEAPRPSGRGLSQWDRCRVLGHSSVMAIRCPPSSLPHLEPVAGWPSGLKSYSVHLGKGKTAGAGQGWPPREGGMEHLSLKVTCLSDIQT